jgi:hypothetical protein
MPGEIEDQPDEGPDGRVLPVTRQAELRMPGAVNGILEGRVVMVSPAVLNCSRRTAPSWTDD